VLPRPLHAEDDGGCATQLAGFAIASTGLAAASAAVTACVTSVVCTPFIGPLLTTLAAATADWSSALGGVNACPSSAAGGGASGGDGSTTATDPSTNDPIDQFINDASTMRTCDPSGADCVYTQNVT
jgi:hypothetical protein